MYENGPQTSVSNIWRHEKWFDITNRLGDHENPAIVRIRKMGLNTFASPRNAKGRQPNETKRPEFAWYQRYHILQERSFVILISFSFSNNKECSSLAESGLQGAFRLIYNLNIRRLR